MKIKQITWQHRTDFSAIYECEFCGHIQSDDTGYDDMFYHDNVIPNKKCDKCGKSTKSEGESIDKTFTKYPEGFQVQCVAITANILFTNVLKRIKN